MALPAGYKQGISRPFHTTRVAAVTQSKTKSTRLDNVLIYVILIAASCIRFLGISTPRLVNKSEAEMGYQVREYMYGRFFVDTDPPLAKLVYFLTALISGWDGVFPFAQIGEEYPPIGGDLEVPFVQMRAVACSFGIVTILATYFLLRSASVRPLVATMGCLLLTVESSFAERSQSFTVEPLYVLGISLAYWGHKKCQLAGDGSSYSIHWFRANLATSIGLGIALSLSELGVHTLAYFVVLAVIHSWWLLGDLEVLTRQWWSQTLFRFFLYLVIPLAFYAAVFLVHFENLYRNGDGLGLVLLEFRVSSMAADSLNFIEMASDISFGSTITLKHVETGEYLHLHNDTYHGGLHEQQVTLYDKEDDLDNQWVIEMRQKTLDVELDTKFRQVKDGDRIKLYHKRTGKYLHANNVRPPILEHDYSNEVSCNGSRGEDLDINYEWKIRIVLKRNNLRFRLPLIKVLADQSVFQIVHQGTRCVLLSHNIKLPSYGHFQREVTCVDEPTIPNTLWYIESNSHPILDDLANQDAYVRIPYKQLGFLSKLLENVSAMRRLRKNLSSSEVGGKVESDASDPESWPFNLKGEVLYRQEDGTPHIYIGNAVIYWSGFFVLMWIAALQVFYYLYVLDPYSVADEEECSKLFYTNGLELLLGWGFHLFPYFSMNGYFYLHNYLPLLYFAILAIAIYIEFQYEKRQWFGVLLLVGITIGAVYEYVA